MVTFPLILVEPTRMYPYVFVGNVYWSDPKTNVVEVSRIDGSERYVVAVVDGQQGKIGAVAVDPLAGRMFWVLNGPGPASGVMTARLDGSDRQGLFMFASRAISDIALDTEVRS